MKTISKSIKRLLILLAVICVSGLVVAANVVVSNTIINTNPVKGIDIEQIHVSKVPVNTSGISSYHGGDCPDWLNNETITIRTTYDFGLNIRTNDYSVRFPSLKIIFSVTMFDKGEIEPYYFNLRYYNPASVDLQWTVPFIGVDNYTLYGSTLGLSGFNNDTPTGGFSIWNDISPKMSSFDGEGFTYIFLITYYNPGTYVFKIWVEEV
jgi:hypothetical protein